LWRVLLTARGQVRSRRSGLIFSVSSASTRGRAAFQSSGGKTRRTGGGAAGDAQDPGEGDPVGIEVGGLGGPGDQRGQRMVDQEPGPDLLIRQLGQARAQDLSRPAQVGLELVVAGLFLPALVVG